MSTQNELFDPFVLLFLVGGLVMIYGIIHVLLHPLDLETRPDEEPDADEREARRPDASSPTVSGTPPAPPRRRRAGRPGVRPSTR